MTLRCAPFALLLFTVVGCCTVLGSPRGALQVKLVGTSLTNELAVLEFQFLNNGTTEVRLHGLPDYGTNYLHELKSFRVQKMHASWEPGERYYSRWVETRSKAKHPPNVTIGANAALRLKFLGVPVLPQISSFMFGFAYSDSVGARFMVWSDPIDAALVSGAQYLKSEKVARGAK